MPDAAPPPRFLPRIGDPAPDFTAPSTHGEITLSRWLGGKWAVLFSHPADFTPVCSTELAEFARRTEDFDRRGARLIGLSVDSVHAHLAWHQNLAKTLGVRLTFPLVADSSRAVSELYGMIHPGASSTATVRALFLIDPKQTVRAILYYPLNAGRNVDEVLRLLDALQTADAKAVALPVNWRPGDKAIVPPPKTEQEVEERLALKDVERLDFYLLRKAL